MRRGLQRAKGFTLFIAVCNSPATATKLIDLLRDSMPGCEIETVELDERTVDPLRDVTSRLLPGKHGPVMILGLERCCPSAAPYHPVLHVLNLQRPEWPRDLPRPVVFWIPEYLLALLGREAPDFLDWRSDTLFFTSGEDALRNLMPIWLGGMEGRLSEAQRRTRVEELRSRIQSTVSSEDPVVLSARSGWLTELGGHLGLLGDLHGSETAFQDALTIEKRLGREGGIATVYSNLGTIDMRRGHLDKAEERFKKSLGIFEKIGDTSGMAATQSHLATVHLERGNLAEAEALLWKVIELSERTSLMEMGAYSNLALTYLQQGRVDRAEDLLQQAIRRSEEAGDITETAAHYRVLGGIHVARGDYDRAEELFLNLLSIDERRAHREGMADDLAVLGIIYKARGNRAKAREAFGKARALYESLGIEGALSRIDASLDTLPSPD